LLNNISDKGTDYETITKSAHILFVTHQNTTLDLIGKLPSFHKELALNNICEFILTKKNLNDPTEV